MLSHPFSWSCSSSSLWGPGSTAYMPRGRPASSALSRAGRRSASRGQVCTVPRVLLDEADEHGGRCMRLSKAAHTSRPWRIHEITRDFRLEDVWALPTPGGPDDFPWLVEGFASADPSQSPSRAAR